MEQHAFNQIVVKLMDGKESEIDLSHLNLEKNVLKKLVENAGGSYRSEKEVQELGHPKKNVLNRYFYVVENGDTHVMGRMHGHFIEKI